MQEACGRASTTTSCCEHCRPLYRTSLIIFMLVSRLTTPPHTESAPTATAEEVSPLSLSVGGCNPVLQMGEYPQSSVSGWHPRPCAQSIAYPTSCVFYRYLQPFPLSFCGSFMLQKSTIVPITKKNKISCLNAWRPVALTPIFSKCFEKLVRDYIALCCLLHWTYYNLHIAATVPQTMLVPSPCTLLSHI